MRLSFLCVLMLSLAGVFSLASGSANAHNPRESYIYLQVVDDRVSGRFEMTIEDLARDLALDADDDGTITPSDFDSNSVSAYAYLADRLRFHTGAETHAAVPTGHRFAKTEFGTYALIEFALPTLGKAPESMEIEFAVPLAGVDEEHQSRLIIERSDRSGVEDNETLHSLVLLHGDGRLAFSLDGLSWDELLLRFIWEGAWHIWIGLDHVLFLVALLLVAAMHGSDRTGQRWQPVETFSSALMYVVKVITVFTLAHSVTLSLATLELVTLPVTPVEVLIALSIAAAALHNLRAVFGQRIWLLVFGFGLLHGFGFANVLVPLGLNTTSLATGLAGFNIGVELGQLVIVLVVFPIIYAARRWSGYQPVIIGGGSVALIAIALFWVVERSWGWVIQQEFAQGLLASAL